MNHFYDVKWGDMDLIIYERTYKSPSSNRRYTELTLLPDPNNPTSFDTAIQQGGRARRRVSFKGAITNIEDYDKLMDDHIEGISRVFIGYDQVPFTSIIESITPLTWRNTFWEYNISLMEVE